MRASPTSRWSRAARRSSRATGAPAGCAWVLDRDRLVEWDGAAEHVLLDVADLPVALGGLARHNVANALAAAGGARALGATREQVADGLRGLPAVRRALAGPAQPVPARPPDGHRGLRAQRGRAPRRSSTWPTAIAGGAAGRAAPVTAIIGTAGDRPDDTLRGIGRIAAARRPSGS